MRFKQHVLVFPGGTEIGLEINKALRSCKDITLFSGGKETSNHAPFVFKRHFEIPDVADFKCIERLNDIIIENEIDYVFPAHDDVLLFLAQNRHQIRTNIITSPTRTCYIARSKYRTYSFLKDVVPIPTIYYAPSYIESYPVFIKPDIGQGAFNAVEIKNKRILEYYLSDKADYVIMENLDGPEYTIDCFSDRENGLQYCGGRERIRTRNGISMNSVPVYKPEFNIYAKDISDNLKFYGAWFFQLKEDKEGSLKLLEIAPRISGTMATNRVLGVNFPLLSIYEHQRKPYVITRAKYDIEIDRALINRYRHNIRYDFVYVDLDDTLIIDNKVNIDLVKFLYQCVNKNKTIILLTKSEENIEQKLRSHKLNGLFDCIHNLDEDDSKAAYVKIFKRFKSIFIDDSFSERLDIEKIGVPTFDCSMIEMLMDDRS